MRGGSKGQGQEMWILSKVRMSIQLILLIKHSNMLSISAIPRVVPVPHQRRRAVTLVPAEDGVIGRHGVSVPCLVGEE